MADDVDPPQESEEQPPNPEPAAQADPPAEPKPEAVLLERVEGMGKSLQQLQQEFSQLNRKSAKGELSQVDEAKRQEAMQKMARLQGELESFAASGEGDFSHKTTEFMLDMNRQLGEVKLENQQLRQKLDSLEPVIKNVAAGSQESTLKAQYPGVDVKKVRKSAQTAADAMPSVKRAKAQFEAGTITEAMFNQLRDEVIDDLFHYEASKSKPPTAAPTPPRPAGGKRSAPFSAGAQNAPASPDDFMTVAMEASREMDEG